MRSTFVLNTDGGARGNPGPAGIGIVLSVPDGTVVEERSRAIGEASNNVAEYTALIEGLACAKEHGATELECRLDSELVIRQMKREYKVKHPDMQRLFVQAWNAVQAIERVTFTAIPREANAHADRLVNEAIDASLS